VITTFVVSSSLFSIAVFILYPTLCGSIVRCIP